MDKHNDQQIQIAQNLRLEFFTNFKSEIAKKSRDGLKTLVKKLNYLCLELDPYNSLDLSIEEENILNELEIKEYLGNPFEFTNMVLQLLDHVEAEIKTRSH
jgi:hypothetical protein